MDKAQFLDVIQKIGTCEDDVERRSLLSDLQEGTAEVFDTNETITKNNEEMTAEIDRLQKENMKLFLRVSSEKEPDDVPPEPVEKRKFEDLFNDKGGIK